MKGRYLYTLDGAEAPLEETFTRDGAQWSACRRTADVTLTVEATLSSAGDLLNARVEWVGAELIGLEISRRDEGLVWQVAREGSARGGRATSTVQDVPAGTYAFPLLRCFQGATVQAIARAGEAGLLVVVPDITDPGAVDRLLTPRVDRRQATLRDDGTYLYVGGSYDSGAICSVGAEGLLERYTWDQPGVGVWDVRLQRSDVPLSS